jgi:excinuclease ABC subunit C
MVVFDAGRPRKAHYRTFVIRNVAGQDDFAMMRQVVARRLSRLAPCTHGAADAASVRAGEIVEAAGYDESFAARPDLILIDGGKGQLSAALAGMREAGVEVAAAGLAKQYEEVFVPGRRDPLPLPAEDLASLLLQRVRDEAHRFALGFHRKRRGATMRASLLDEIPGVGPVRRRRIVEYFGSPDRVLAASAEELEAVPGLPRKVAREIHEQLHKAGL